jgi:hypothetical protein
VHWPISTVTDIRPERLLSGDELPPTTQRAGCGTTIFPSILSGTYTHPAAPSVGHRDRLGHIFGKIAAMIGGLKP